MNQRADEINKFVEKHNLTTKDIADLLSLCEKSMAGILKGYHAISNAAYERFKGIARQNTPLEELIISRRRHMEHRRKNIKQARLDNIKVGKRNCNLCGVEFEAKSKLSRFCKRCKNTNDAYNDFIDIEHSYY